MELTPKQFTGVIELGGLESVYVFSSDYPHWDADSPSTALRGLSPELRTRIAGTNALDVYPRLRAELG